MTKQELLVVLGMTGGQEVSLAEMLIRTTFDDLVEIDVKNRHYRFLYHEEDKYVGILEEGDYDRLYSYACEHFIHPDDISLYRDMMNPESLIDRLRYATIPGAIAGSVRMKGTDGRWIRTRYLLIHGPEIGLADHIVHVYIYDIEGQWERKNRGNKSGKNGEREDGTNDQDGLVLSGKGEEVTGLLNGMDYFRPMQSIFQKLGDGWCIIDIYIEHFKVFTAWYGLESARYLLAELGELLSQFAAETGGYPGYLGQEEFMLVMPFDKPKIRTLHESMKAIIGKVSMIDGFSPLFGIAMIDGSKSQIMEYFNHAALARRELSGDAKNRIILYDAEKQKKTMEEYEILYQFRDALKNGEITFWLQPQVRASNGKIVGAEALARWIRPDGTKVSPADFVPILEKYRIISLLDTYIWEEVCKWLCKRREQGLRLLPVSINISQIDIDAMDVPVYLSDLLKRYQLMPKDLEVEITESACANDFDHIRDTLIRLREMGFQVLMDDFGSGYSSLNMLRSLNVDVIKLDSRFLQMERGEQKKGISILESVVHMTKTLSVPVIVEGVETKQDVQFLREQGCPYMQGYYFYRPMPPAEFDTLANQDSRIDEKGIVFKANQQLRSREFLDEHIYSDTMLNNILGPVVFYNLHGKDIDIIRYNEQFYELVGIDLEEFSSRSRQIQAYIYPEDKASFYKMFEEAEQNLAVGSTGVVRTYQPNGVLAWLSLKLYFIGEDAQGKKFYASARDVSDLQVVNMDIPGGYYRCTMDDDFTFLYISRNFERLTGYSAQEIRSEFHGHLAEMVHPDDLATLRHQAEQILVGDLDVFLPYRIRRKRGDYIYVAEQSYLTDRYGALCWQSMLIDVNDVMQIRNRMQIISEYMKNTVLFLHRTPEKGLVYEVAVNGLGEHMGLDDAGLADCLNTGEFCTWVEGYRAIPHREYTEQFISSILGHPRGLTVHLPQGKTMHLEVRADRVKNKKSTVEYIVIMNEMP